MNRVSFDPMHGPFITVDCDYVQKEFAAAYIWVLPVDLGGVGIIETNTTHAIPHILQTLQRLGKTPLDVEWIAVTHVHLDHAGGAGALAQLCPQAQVLAHPRAARHLIDPTRIVASARQVYGEENFRKLYGHITPVPESQVKICQDSETMEFHGRTVEFLHTRGHAKHHMCLWIPEEGAVFTGDSFGVSYPAINRGGHFTLPSTSPVDFEKDEALKTLDRIMALQPNTIWPTHFGPIARAQIEPAFKQLRETLELSGRLAASTLSETEVLAELKTLARQQLLKLGHSDVDEALGILELDLRLNAQGLMAARAKALAPQGVPS